MKALGIIKDLLFVLASFVGLTLPCIAADDAGTLSLSLRKRVETKQGSGRFHTLVQPTQWDAKKTAIIVCDVWDSHHCLNAVRRVGEMAPRMNQLLSDARKRGVLIIHAPSGCMDAYKDHPARQNAVKAPRASNLPKDIGSWCYRIPAEEKGVYPIDQTDGGEDDDPAEHRAWAEKLQKMGRNPKAPWKSQIDVLKIDDCDFISDKGEEIWSVLHQRGIDNVILVGVHTNMCVLGRPFGLRQMAKNGKNVVLMRDLTDTMYNPARAPFVSHFTGTDLIVEHIEKWVCPTITSDQILGGKPFRFSGDKRPHLVLVMAESEYQTERTLPEFALKHLGKDFRISTVFGSETDAHDLPGLDVLNEADLALISVRRRALPSKQMSIIRKFVDDGKPLVGIRTASHAFSLRDKKPPEGCATWETFDPEVWGGHYTNHHGDGPKVEIKAAEGAANHPILAGVNLAELRGNGSLYKVSPLVKSTTPLLIGSIPDKPTEPVLWTHTTKSGGRVVYTSLGHWDDFKEAAFNRLLSNAIHWAAGLPVGKTDAAQHLRSAEQAIQRWDFPRAGEELAKCIQLGIDNTNVRLLAARTARRAGDYREAEKHLDAYQRLKGEAKTVALEKALARAQRGELAGVETEIDILKAPNFIRRAQCSELSEPEKDLLFLSEIKKAHPDALLILEALARGYVESYCWRDALKCLDEWLERQPKNTQALFWRAGVHEYLPAHIPGISSWTVTTVAIPGGNERALADYRLIVKLDPEHDAARFRLAEGLLGTSKYGEALKHFQHLHKRHPKDAVVLAGLAHCRIRIGEIEEGQKLLDLLLTDNPRNARALREKGRLLLTEGKWAGAEKLLRQAAAFAPADYQTFYLFALCLSQAGKEDEARKVEDKLHGIEDNVVRFVELLKRLNQSPRDPALRYEVGIFLIRNGRETEGARWLHTALLMDPRHRPTHQALADYYQRTGKTELADKHREQTR